MSERAYNQSENLPDFKAAVCHELENCGWQELAIWYMDIKKFRFVNEALGYSVGDSILEDARDFLDEVLGEGDCFVHLSDDRFALFTKGLDREQAIESFEHDCGSFNGRLAERGIGHALDIAAGVYFITKDDIAAPDVSKMIDFAHTAHKRAKAMGGNSISIFDFEFHEKQRRELAIESALEEAIANEDIEVWMQPQINYLTGHIVGSETLARWDHATLGRLSPGEFIPVLERCGKIRMLDSYIWETACRKMHEWHVKTGYELVPFSVNISRAEILDPGLTEHFVALREKYDLPEKILRLEVTETTYTEQPRELIRAVNSLREAGFIVEMDDFGSGYSSLNMLRNLPVDVLKLDMGFLQGEDDESSDAVILNCVIRMAHGLDIPIIAEGVETFEQAEMLKTMGCSLMQGYYFSRPLPIEDYQDLFNQGKARRQTFAWANEFDHTREVLNMRDATPFMFNHCIGPAMVLTSNGDHYEAVLANDKFFEVVGHSEDSSRLFSTGNMSDYLSPQAARALKEALERCAEVGTARIVVQLPDSPRTLECTLHHIGFDERGEMVMSLLRDITDEAPISPLPAGASAIGNAQESAGSATPQPTAEEAAAKEPEEDSPVPVPSAADLLSAPQGTWKDRALHDGLTGTLNREGLESIVAAKLGQADGGAMFVVDIDGFHAINDRLGILSGDATLCAVADVLGSMFRDGDALGRFGSDEFVAFIAGLHDEALVCQRAAELVARVGQIDQGSNGKISCCVGVAIDPDPQTSFYALLEQAEAAKRTSKAAGGGSWHVNVAG